MVAWLNMAELKEIYLFSFGLTQVAIQNSIPVISTPSIDAYFNH